MHLQEHQHIAVMRTDRVGDLILSTPVFAALRNAYPTARITAVVSRYSHEVLIGNPNVDHILIYDDRRSRARYKELRDQHFSTALALAPISACHRLAFASRAPRRIGYVYRSRPTALAAARLYLTDLLVCEVDQKDLEQTYRTVPHEVEQNLELLKYLGITPQETRLDLHISSRETADAAAILSSLGMTRESLILGVHLSTALVEQLPEGFFSSFLKALVKAFGAKVLVTYGPKEESWVHDIEDQVRSRFVQFVGYLPLKTWAALIGHCRLFISANTGAAHVAAAAGIPVVCVMEDKFFAYHSQRWHPWGVPYVLVRKQHVRNGRYGGVDSEQLKGGILEGVAAILEVDGT
ncbi:MAG: glycosyltransferase family 9 protein [Armatimonadetes bacterium]|nr:glycosyltransferase family 9 protein [Armatimonadota bacterium]